MPALPLKGVRVLDLSRHLPGPYVTAALADLGATVVKIEERDLGDPTRGMAPPVADGSDSALHAWLNRGKKSVAIDLEQKDACVTPVLSMTEVMADPQVRARQAFLPQRTSGGTFLSPTFLPQITRRSHRRRAPGHGEHTRAVLSSLGYSKARILKLRDTGVIQ